MGPFKSVVFISLLISATSTSGHLVRRSKQIVQCQSGQYPPPEKDRIQKFIINLDLPPKDRWTQVIVEKKAQVLNLLHVFQNFTELIFPGNLFKFVDKYLPLVAQTLPEPYYSELKGMADIAGIPLGEITLYNIFYELFSVCTSLVVQGTDGHLFHARNLDFGLLLGWDTQNHTWLITEALHPLVVALDFQRGNKTIFKSVNYAGQVGVLTGLKPELFSLSLDRRFHLEGGAIAVIRWLMGDHSSKWTGFLMRTVLEEATGYDEALGLLMNSKLLAPVYFIIGGNAFKQAAVVTRGRTDAELWPMGTASISQNSTWFLVETNYDHWKEPPFYDDRRTPTVYCLDQVGQRDISLAVLYNVLSTKPVLNKLTTYTSLMDVSTGELETWLRYCPEPCAPW